MKIYIENTYTIRINNGNILNAKGKENIDVEMINTIRNIYASHNRSSTICTAIKENVVCY